MSATAELIALPSVKVITVARLPLKRREELLTTLARNADGYDPEELAVLLCAWVTDSLSGRQLQLAFTDFCERLSLLDEAMRGGGGDVRVVDGEVVYPQEEAQAALDVLTGQAEMRWTG